VRAAVRTRYGPPEVVRVVDVDRPEPGPHDVLVRVHATTVNRTDCAYRAGSPFFLRLARPVPVLGTEFAGVVEATGERVFGYVEGRFGAHAEYLVVDEHAAVAPVPPGVDLDVAAAATEGAHYALGLIRVARVQRGRHVLVLGATGAIGSAAVQLLKAGGVVVTAAAREHAEVVAGLGADRVVAAAAEDVPDDGTRYDAVLDAVGKSTFRRCRPLLAPGGVYTSSELGPKAQNLALAAVSPLVPGRRRVRFPYPVIDRRMVERIAALLGDGRFRPLVDRGYPLAEIVDAYRYAETGRKLGSVVVRVVDG
jgi:NADPH:quinone reductase-like Zn-dependent oxidoreductase